MAANFSSVMRGILKGYPKKNQGAKILFMFGLVSATAFMTTTATVMTTAVSATVMTAHQVAMQLFLNPWGHKPFLYIFGALTVLTFVGIAYGVKKGWERYCFTNP